MFSNADVVLCPLDTVPLPIDAVIILAMSCSAGEKRADSVTRTYEALGTCKILVVGEMLFTFQATLVDEPIGISAAAAGAVSPATEKAFDETMVPDAFFVGIMCVTVIFVGLKISAATVWMSVGVI